MMKKCLVAFALTVLASVPAAAHVLNDDEIKTVEKGDIVVHVQEVPGTNVKKGQAFGIVSAPTEQVWRIISDYNHYKDFMPRTIETFVVNPELIAGITGLYKEKGSDDVEKMCATKPIVYPWPSLATEKVSTVFIYAKLDFPWPVENKWYVIKIGLNVEQLMAGWDLIKGNMKENKGYWKLEPYEGNRTLLEYSLHTDPGGSVPDFLINFGTKVTLPDVVKVVMKRAKEYDYPAIGNPQKKGIK
jgi:ribosome-associated toxin RatA of RatAB toxin-antitoxin module